MYYENLPHIQIMTIKERDIAFSARATQLVGYSSFPLPPWEGDFLLTREIWALKVERECMLLLEHLCK